MITIIGLTGQSGSGKTLLCNMAKEFNIDSVDTDKVYHDLLVPPSDCLNEIVECFGKNVLNEDGTLDRQSLGKIVFSKHHNPNNLEKLNHITHKFILKKTREIISQSKSKAIIIDAPALFESGFDKECNFVIFVSAEKSIRERRIIERDNLTKENANLRLSAQKDNSFYASKSDFEIKNNGNADDLKKDFLNILKSKNLI